MIVKLLTEHHLEFLSLIGGCRGSCESTIIKMPHCWKSHATAQLSFSALLSQPLLNGWHQNILSEGVLTSSVCCFFSRQRISQRAV